MGLVALGLAMTATTQVGMTAANASMQPSAWINEQLTPFYTTGNSLRGADCYNWYTAGQPWLAVTVHAPAAQGGSSAATIEWWARLYRTDTGADLTGWYYGGNWSVPAYSGPVVLGSPITFPYMPNAYVYQIRAQVYVRIHADSPAEGSLLVTRYNSQNTTMANC
jgi:hypothetical protein